ncbi:MAG: glutamate formimidoyltransferase [Bdellovibrionales bacterium]|nr:glutamate formimidoyltransferase [Bdellovibrionales bacterium]
MVKLIECVPNVSVGNDPRVLGLLEETLDVRGVQLLHVDSGISANRSVFTIVGEPDALKHALLSFIGRSILEIDLRAHSGVHPRVGAVDVVPLVPISGVTMQDCVEFSHQLAALVADRYQVPVSMYEASARTVKRRSLAYLRKGGFESLQGRLAQPDMHPDYGGTLPHPSAGMIVMGARPFLVAFNLTLATDNVTIADEIAEKLRESGSKRFGSGLLKRCRAIGWFIPEYGAAQISMNILDYRVTPLSMAYHAASELAATYGTSVVGAELIGMLPREALVLSGRFIDSTIEDPLELAIAEMKLRSHGFELKQRILEERLSEILSHDLEYIAYK